MLLETTVSAGAIFGSEFLGTMILIILGVGVVANNLLPKTKGNPGPGSLQINWGWGFGVMFGVYGAYRTGGHLNPAVTVGLALAGKDLAPGVEATAGNICLYIIAQFLGAFVGAILCWPTFKKHFDEEAPVVRVSALKALEDQLGVQLVRRGSRYRGLTPEGARVLDWARRIVGDARTMQAELRARIESLQARIRPHFLFNSLNSIASLIEIDPIANAVLHASVAAGTPVDAFVVRMTIVPAVMSLLGRAAWWLPKWL